MTGGRRWRGRRTTLVLAAALAVCGLLAGCAQIPTGGPVRSGRELGYEQHDSYVRALPAPPRPGAGPLEIVRGFLEASASLEDDYATARLFLSPSARERWDPAAKVTVYDTGQDTSLTQTSGTQVVLAAPTLATISRDGVYDPARPGTALRVGFTLARSGGQWRIQKPPDGLLLTEIDVSRSYRSVNVYFLDPLQQTLVPDAVFVPQSPAMSTTLVKRLLAGPSSWLRPGVTTAFPVGTGLSGSVPVDNGVAQVDLTDVALSAPPKAREAMSAQLVWTLSQVGDVQAVRITVAGAAFKVANAAEVQPRESWRDYDPGALPSDVLPYVVRGGRLGTLDDGTFEPVPGPLGAGTVRLDDPAVTPRGDLVAGLTADRRHLLAGPTASRPQARLTGSSLSAPSWDASPAVWVADRGAAGSRLWVVPRVGDPVQVQVQGLAGQRVTAVRVARDGTRVALVTTAGRETALYVGSVVRGDGRRTPPRVEGLRRLATDLTAITDISWSEASQLAVLARSGTGDPTVYLVDLDGATITAAPPQRDVVTVAAAPRPLSMLVGTADGQIYRLAGRRWVVEGRGTDPLYPG